MAGVEADFWVCGDCRSVNKLRAKQCYNCRTPKEVAEVDPAQIEATGHGRLREITLPEYNSSRGEAILASALIILVAAMQVVSTVLDAILLGRIVRNPGLLSDPAFARSIEVLAAGTLALALLGVALLALTAWAYWLSRVVVAMPALGLGYPAANGLMAFVENFLPGLNLLRVPAIVRDVIRRLEPGSGRGEALIFAAWIGLLGGFVVPRLGGFVGAFGSGELEDAVGQTILIQGISTGLVLVGAIFLVVLIWWIEQRIVRRRAAQLAGEPAPPTVDAAAASATAAAPREVAAPMPFAERPAEQPFAPPAVVTPDVATPVAPHLPAQPDATPPRPLGATSTLEARAELMGTTKPSDDEALHRPITAVTGAASVPGSGPGPRPADVSPEAAGPLEIAQTAVEAPPPAAASTAEAPQTRSAPVPEPSSAVDAVPPAEGLPAPAAPAVAAAEAAGLQLILRVESASSMIATMDDESEPITLEGLRAAAEALARAGGSAVIAADGTSFGALSLAEQAFEILSDAQVPTTVQD